jgi:Adenylate and Guanylate cyclase catalytic domain
VTAGVLRGEKGRFQLFGDVRRSVAFPVYFVFTLNEPYLTVPFVQTVNTAARMESTGARNRIHCSQATATLLESAGKSWTTHRDDLVHAKGKGDLQTHWVELVKQRSTSRRTGSMSSLDEEKSTDKLASALRDKEWAQVGLMPMRTLDNNREAMEMEEKRKRLIDWNAYVLCRLLAQVVAQKQIVGESESESSHRRTLHASNAKIRNGAQMVIDEVVEVIELPKSKAVSEHDVLEASRDASLDSMVAEQVRAYVEAIAKLHPNNHFHNFEHVRLRSIQLRIAWIPLHSRSITSFCYRRRMWP